MKDWQSERNKIRYVVYLQSSEIPNNYGRLFN